MWFGGEPKTNLKIGRHTVVPQPAKSTSVRKVLGAPVQVMNNSSRALVAAT